MASDRRAARRRYGEEIKARVLAECAAPGASVAKVAMSHGINANVVHRWRQLAREAQPALLASNGEFVPLSLPTMSGPTEARCIQVQVRRGTTAMTIIWPVSAAAEFGTWMRELLR